MVGYPLRFCEPFLALKGKKESGVLGEVQIVYATMVGPGPFMHRADGYSPRPVPRWWFQRELTGGGALIDMGSHMINLLRWYLGEVTDVTSYFKHRYNMDSEDQAMCLMRFETGASALLNVGWFSQKSQTKIEMYGTFQYDSAEHEAPSKIVTFLQLLTRRTPAFFLPYLSELEHFVQSIRCDSQPSPSCEDGLRDLEAISLAYNNGTVW